ncbi:MAG TPA: DUF4382 domain-containing protein [Candidatus Sulfotelmatobacter sp.]|jgi:hypothetical protein|nr:DUF4382 domain-containing protein [Candidatus Sulfotelmatobacter sp.]
MNPRKYLVFAVFAAALLLSSCSGLHNRCVTNCGGNGNASLSVSISDTPPTNTTVLSFTLPIVGISLTSSSGSQVSVFSSGTASNFELTRLQTDSDVVVTNASVAAGTYTAVNVTVGAASGIFINNSGATVGSCPAGSVCGIPPGVTTTITAPINLTLTSDAHQWLDLDFNYNNAIVTTGGIGINMQQANVLSATATVPTGVPSGDFAFVDDFTGRVTAVSSGSITLSSTVRGSLTATINGSTAVFDPQGQCSTAGSATLSCIHVGSIVSLQGVLTNTGTVLAASLDIIDFSTTPADEAEGTIYPSTCNGGSNFGLIISDSSITTSGSPLASAGFGSGVCLRISPTATFPVDFGILTGQPGLPVTGFTNANDLLAGQTVRAKITGAATGTNGLIDATATAMILRFSRLTGTVGTVSTTGFTISGLPSYITAFTTLAQVQTYQNATILEGVSTSGLQGTASISALFFNPSTSPTTGPLQAAKVRQH